MLGRHYSALWPVARGVKVGIIGTQSFGNSVGVRKGINIFPSSAHIVSPRNEKFFSAQPRTLTEESIPSLQSTKHAPILSRLQEECWDAYKSTGRGCLTLFQLIDTDRSNTISCAEVKYFMDNVKRSGINPAAQQEILERSNDHQIDFPEFQSWLIRATKFDQQSRNTHIQEMYDIQPDLGDRYKPKQENYSWNQSTMSQGLRRMQYAVRGEVVMRADALAAEGREITFTNIGNPHSVGQKPISFYREVLALCDLPAEYGVNNPDICKNFSSDVIERAKEMRQAIGPAGTGAYTNSQGILEFRKDVAKYISTRDGHEAFPANIFLTNGASSAIEMILSGLISDDNDAIMIPIPQYPIYSALIGRMGARQIGYYLDESLGWAVTEEELEKRWEDATAEGLNIKALAMINPGNPTGQVLERKDVETICKFCAKNGILLMADEVYQRNVYVEDKEFISAKKVALETPGCESLQLVSFHSTSKGFIGECGRRGGYMELHHIDPYVQTQIYKLASAGLCSGVSGQIMTSLMLRPPLPGGESYEKFQQEEGEIFESLKRRAKSLVDGLNAIDGIECLPAEGAMYAFPSIELPQKALDEAEENKKPPDTIYALSLLEETGICVVPASGFGQAPGRIGFRTTFLPPEDKIIRAIGEFKRHHELFCKRYE
mmetsp:Transcript_31928/g.48979  ORF Transcript_31928/g.48979 Transcript_31928/m.48979 type:complete len:661 (-) Transcript_31928:211-2193(-)